MEKLDGVAQTKLKETKLMFNVVKFCLLRNVAYMQLLLMTTDNQLTLLFLLS